MSTFAEDIKAKIRKNMSGNKNALKPPEKDKELVTEDDRGRRLWDRGEYQKIAQHRLKVYVFEINTFLLIFNKYSDMEKATKYGPDANLEKRDLPSSMRDPVQARKKKLDMESGIGKTVKHQHSFCSDSGSGRDQFWKRE